MKIKINAKDLKITEGMQDKVEKKFNVFNKYLKESDEITILIKKDNLNYRMKAIVPTVNNETNVIEKKHPDFYALVDVLVEKTKETYLQERKRYTCAKKQKVGVEDLGLVIDTVEEGMLAQKKIKKKKVILDEVSMLEEELKHAYD